MTRSAFVAHSTRNEIEGRIDMNALRDPVLKVTIEDMARMHTYAGRDQAMDEWRRLKSNKRKPVAFWVPGGQYKTPSSTDEFIVLDASDGSNDAQIRDLTYVAKDALIA